MRLRRIFVLFSAISMFFSLQASAEVIVPKSGKTMEGKAPFSTAIIYYKISGDSINGSEVVYIDLLKNMACRDAAIESKRDGKVRKGNFRELVEGEKISRIDFNNNIAADFKTENNDIIRSLFNENLFSDSYKGKRYILGKECKEYRTDEEALFFWEGILLREEIINHPMGKNANFIRQADKISLDIAIPADKFEIPQVAKAVSPEEFFRIVSEAAQENAGVNSAAQSQDLENFIEDVKKMKEEIKNAP
ncbi:MAG: hypothetical protein PHN59_01335 [Candidatus Omnitrophica bacterium]|nr:hypothetical protein [Candidatus Omnitrophota bacterium]